MSDWVPAGITGARFLWDPQERQRWRDLDGKLCPGMTQASTYTHLHQLSHQGSPRILEWVAYPFFPTQESNQGLLHLRQIPYQLSYWGTPGSSDLTQFYHSLFFFFKEEMC